MSTVIHQILVKNLTKPVKFCWPLTFGPKDNCAVILTSDGVSRPVMETETKSRDSSRDPFVRVLVSKVSGLETLNIAKKSFIKISMIQRFFVCCVCR